MNKEAMKLKLLNISDIEHDENQARTYFDKEALEDLQNSIAKVGLLYPIIVRKKEDAEGKYIIVAGERRFRAVTAITNDSENPELSEKHKQINSFILESEDYKLISLIENIQREDLTEVEKAEGIKKLSEEKKVPQGDLAKIIGKSESRVSEILAITKLPKPILKEARRRKDTPFWLLTELTKIKDKEEQIKSWKALKDRNITRKIYREEKAASNQEKPKQLKSTDITRPIKSLVTQISGWKPLVAASYSPEEIETIHEELKKLYNKLDEFKATLKTEKNGEVED